MNDYNQNREDFHCRLEYKVCMCIFCLQSTECVSIITLVTETQDCDFFNFFTNPKRRRCSCVCVNHWMSLSRVPSSPFTSKWLTVHLAPVMSCRCRIVFLIQCLISATILFTTLGDGPKYSSNHFLNPSCLLDCTCSEKRKTSEGIGVKKIVSCTSDVQKCDAANTQCTDHSLPFKHTGSQSSFICIVQSDPEGYGMTVSI